MKFVKLILLSCFLSACNQNHESGVEYDRRGEVRDVGNQGLFSYRSDNIVLEEEKMEIVNYNQAPVQKKQSQKIIKTARLRYETQDLEATRAQVLDVIKNAQAYIQDDNSGKDYNQLYHRLTVRVPTKNFQQVLDGVAQGVAYFDERTINQKDVTEEFIDLNARLKAKRKLEDRYLALLAKAKNVKEMLEIERELAKIREEIEAKQGRVNYLESQVSLSTLHIHFYKVTATTGVTQSYGSKIANALKNGWNSISVFFLSLLHIWPFIILVGLALLYVRRWIKKRKRKKS